MADENLTDPLGAGDLDPEDVTLEAELVDDDAEREIDKAVRGRHAIARKYVRWVRRQHPDATPAEIISMLEHHYVTAISAAGTAITVGGIAAEVGISLIPGAGGAAAGTKAVAKEAGKKVATEATKAAVKKTAKTSALGAARGAAARLLPAGDKQIQFEITALFALAVADIHGLDLDQRQSQTLVLRLSNARRSQKQIGPAQNLVRGLGTEGLDDIVGGLDGRKQAAVEYGAGAVVGGISRFVFGREVVDASRSAFPAAPDTFPAYLGVPVKPEKEDSEPNKALEALEDAAKAVGTGVSTRAVAVGAGVASAADSVTRPFHSVDLDGDGVPDEPQALTAVKGVSGAIAGAAGAVGDGVSGFFKPKKRAKHAAGGPHRELETRTDEDTTEV